MNLAALYIQILKKKRDLKVTVKLHFGVKDQSTWELENDKITDSLRETLRI